MRAVSGRDAVLMSDFGTPGFEPGPQNKKNLGQLHVLVVGAGGLGCEILKNLALLGFQHIDVIDMDTIDLTNLNRQFLFRERDIGKSKAEVAAAFVADRVRGVYITPHACAIQDKPDDFYRQFHIVICGLDSVVARRWINAKVVGLVDEADPTSLRPLIDGGTEALQGQVRVILPTITACYECSLGMLVKQTTYPLCTIASHPRLPEHCIEWATVMAWPKEFSRPYDTDSPDDLEWILQVALERARAHAIEGVTLTLAQSVVKKIIPAVASTNAIIAGACCTEAFKIATSAAKYLDNYMMYSGVVSVYTHTFSLEKNDECPVCGTKTVVVTFPAGGILRNFVDMLKDSSQFSVSKPSLASQDRLLYFESPPALRKQTEGNLDLALGRLIDDGDEIAVTDPQIPFNLRLTVRLQPDGEST